MYRIMCQYKHYSVEEIDRAETKHRANELLQHYKESFGDNFTVWCEEIYKGCGVGCDCDCTCEN